MKIFILIISILIFSLSLDASTLDKVKERGFLKCGVSEGLIGFALPNDKGEWKGFDVDICRAIAAAVLGDSNKVEFISTSSRSRFPILASGEIDILSSLSESSISLGSN